MQSRFLLIRFSQACFIVAVLAFDTVSVVAAQPELEPAWRPAWAEVRPTTILVHSYRTELPPEQNGRALAEAIERLEPGTVLRIGPGTYLFTAKTVVDLAGRREAPIWIESADPNRPAVLVRDGARQNLLEVGARTPSRFVCLRNLELRGGSNGIRFYHCDNIWLDGCEIHHAKSSAVTANTYDTHSLYITRNHMHHFLGGTGEGMYLGGNHGSAIMRDSVIAANHVHDCSGSQGDGIELKQGSYNNLIVANHVHDTQYPCIVVYGTDGKEPNRIERNVCYRSGDNVMQVQGEAIVQNNLLMAGRHTGFTSTDHQGKTKNLHFIHNTVINEGTAVNLSSWHGRDGMIFANNAVYGGSTAVRLPGGADPEITFTGNVCFGRVQGFMTGFVAGTGLDDFLDVTWDATGRNARPAAESPLFGSADPRYSTQRDLSNKLRASVNVAGALISQ